MILIYMIFIYNNIFFFINSNNKISYINVYVYNILINFLFLYLLYLILFYFIFFFFILKFKNIIVKD